MHEKRVEWAVLTLCVCGDLKSALPRVLRILRLSVSCHVLGWHVIGIETRDRFMLIIHIRSKIIIRRLNKTVLKMSNKPMKYDAINSNRMFSV